MQIDLRNICDKSLQIVNPGQLVSILHSTGYTEGYAGIQEPTYAPAVTGFAQLQAVDNEILQHTDGLNLQATYRTLYISDQLYAVVHPNLKGGDLVDIGTDRWLVVKITERWETWCKVLLCLQLAPP